MNERAHWETNAAWWQREFTQGADVEYEDQILPMVARHVAEAGRVLDVGCGEGQVARRLAGSGCRVVGVDSASAQLCAAVGRGGGPAYARGEAERLPFRDGAFDAVVICLALEHVDEFAVALGEASRVLAPAGRLLLVLAHPLLQAPGSRWVDDKILDERYWRMGDYLHEHTFVEEVAPDVEFAFAHRPVHRYINAMADAGLFVESMEEPPPPRRLLAALWDYPEADTIPRVLALRARRLR